MVNHHPEWYAIAGIISSPNSYFNRLIIKLQLRFVDGKSPSGVVCDCRNNFFPKFLFQQVDNK
ncbi:hypothetical protein, partial [Chryseobacterium sp. CH1]|uniref:hypothetical protein n=1 Tax=Chryseobacterium sp. CH1 TaxID=713551 RepID=UPI001E414366